LPQERTEPKFTKSARGWIDPEPLAGSVSGIKQLDNIAKVFAEIDKADLKRRLGK
jgi:hypothetical protein